MLREPQGSPELHARTTQWVAVEPLPKPALLPPASRTLFYSTCEPAIMSLYDLHNAKLNEMEGEGFAYSQKTVYGKSYKGVFFGENEDEIEKLADEDEEATFEGILYDRSREREKSFSVEITDVISTPSGERADFVATEKP